MIPILSLQYLPPISYFKLLLEHGTGALESHEHFQKGSYRNRCYIATAAGRYALSIPLQKGKNQQQSIRAVRIVYDQNWQKQHWQTIRSAYSNAPFWEHYADTLEGFYQKKEAFLWDYNLHLLEKCIQMLKIKTFLQTTPAYILPFEGVQEIQQQPYQDFRAWIHPKHIAEYLPVYTQVFAEKNGFLADLSIIDLLLCYGGQYARTYLQNCPCTSP